MVEIKFGLCMFTWLYSLSPLYQNLTDFILYIFRRSMRSHASLMPCPIAVCEHIWIFWLKSPSTANDALWLACVVLLTASVIPFWTSWSIPNKKHKTNSVLYADSTINFENIFTWNTENLLHAYFIDDVFKTVSIFNWFFFLIY